MAVGDGGSAGVEPFGGRSIQLLQRDVDGTGNVFRLVIPRSEDINELSTLPDELLDRVTVDHRGHGYPPTDASFSASAANASAMRESRADLRPRASAGP